MVKFEAEHLDFKKLKQTQAILISLNTLLLYLFNASSKILF